MPQPKMSFLSLLALSASSMAAKLNFTMSVSPPPQPGSPFLITWTPPPPPATQKIEILLNYFDSENPSLPIITTNTILDAVPDNGSWIWNVPSDLCGRHSFGLAFDFRNPSTYGEIWELPCPAPVPATV